MPQKLLPSRHLMEVFAPYLYDEKRMLDVMKKVVDFDFYRNLELGVFFDQNSRRESKRILEENDLRGSVFVTPYIKDRHLSLCSLDAAERRKAVELCKSLARLIAEAGCNTLGVPSGDDPGICFRGPA